MGNARVLYRLQQIDAEAQSTRKLVAELMARLGESGELLDAAARLSDAERQFERVQSTQKEREIELQAVMTKLAVDQGKLYDGKMGNPKELKNLQDEVDSLMRRRDHLQDAVLESMIEVEAARQAAEAARVARAEIEGRWSGDQTDAAQQLEVANTHAAHLAHARAEVESRLSP
jgi:predicted  nucleic acid-binding Zn-ribbon protein